MKKTISLIPIIIFSFVVGGISTIALLKWTPVLDTILESRNIGTKREVYEKSSLSTSVDKAYDSVVLVENYKNDVVSSTGTGFVYKVDNKYAYILTNEHVITDASKVKVIFTNEEEVETEVLGSDQYLDIAVLRLKKDKIISVALIGNSENMHLGDSIFTIGSPLGRDYMGSVTSGILSGKDRLVSVKISKNDQTDWVVRVLQIDASINPGNSGAPLLNVNGEVIGICSMKLVDNEVEGMGFAIPIEYAMSHVKTLEKSKKIKWPVIGIRMVNPTDSVTLNEYNISLSADVREGAVIIEVLDDSAASKAGLKKGDIVIKINNAKIKNYAHLRYQLYQYEVGNTINMIVLRDGKEKNIKVTLE